MKINAEMRVAVIAGIFGLIGAVIGSGLTIFFAGYTESEKLLALQKKNAVDAFIEEAWEDPNNNVKSTTKYFTMLNKLSVYAPKELIEALGNYHGTSCSEKEDTGNNCKELWAQVVHEIRKLSGSDQVTDSDIIKLLWGK